MAKSYEQLNQEFMANFPVYGDAAATVQALGWTPEDVQTFNAGVSRPAGTYLGTGTDLPLALPQSNSPLRNRPSQTTLSNDSLGMPGDTGGGGGWMDTLKGWGLTLPDILKLGGNLVEGYTDYRQGQESNKQNAEALAERKREFDQNFGLQQDAQAISVADRLNRAPLADRGQFLAMNATAPTPFQPRDYTQGLDKLRTPATGGAAAQVAANAAASSKYTPGAGGVNTDTLRMIQARTMPQPPQPSLTPAGMPDPNAVLSNGYAALDADRRRRGLPPRVPV